MIHDAALLPHLQGIVQRVDLAPPGNGLLHNLWCANPGDSRMQLGILHQPEHLSPHQLRTLFEQWQQTAEQPQLLIFLDTPYANLEKMRQMCELYGW
ncbi:MAG: hypothetical protein R3E89_08315 [Thiolinea sp.]